jgi:putative ABC transport system ATP-binding protein
MTLLEFDHVSKSYGAPGHEQCVLREVSMELEAGELASVWGLRRSGRSTLLRIAAGIEPPDVGAVRFEGRPLDRDGESILGGGIGYCQRSMQFTDGESALDHAMVGLLARWVSPPRARARAMSALERVGAAQCAPLRQRELSAAETVKIALARTLALEPRLIVIDEPVKGVELIDRDEILLLLRTLANEGIAVLASTGESTGLSEADRAFALGGGELRGTPPAESAPVLELRRHAARRASG